MGIVRPSRRMTTAVALVLACVAGGCANEGDVRARWVEAFGTPDGVDRLNRVSCQEPFIGTLEGCLVKVDLDDDVDAATATAIVKHFLEVAEELYPEGSEERQELGGLAFDDGTDRTYIFDAQGDDRDGPLRTGPDAAAVDAFVRMRDDDRFHRVDIRDPGEPGSTRATIELPGDDPQPLFATIGRLAGEFRELGGATFQASVSRGRIPGVADVSVTTKQGAVPTAEWRFALGVVEREHEYAYDVRVAPGTVHLVAVVPGAGDDEGRLEDVAQIRERTVARAPEGITVSVGSRPRRS